MNLFLGVKEYIRMNDSIFRGLLDEIKQAVSASNADGKRGESSGGSLASIFSMIGERQNQAVALGDRNGAFHGYGVQSNIDIPAQRRRWAQGIQAIPETPDFIASGWTAANEDAFTSDHVPYCFKARPGRSAPARSADTAMKNCWT